MTVENVTMATLKLENREPDQNERQRRDPVKAR